MNVLKSTKIVDCGCQRIFMEKLRNLEPNLEYDHHISFYYYDVEYYLATVFKLTASNRYEKF